MGLRLTHMTINMKKDVFQARESMSSARFKSGPSRRKADAFSG
jgi:hypothetical protein